MYLQYNKSLNKVVSSQARKQVALRSCDCASVSTLNAFLGVSCDIFED